VAVREISLEQGIRVGIHGDARKGSGKRHAAGDGRGDGFAWSGDGKQQEKA
jgi:hypothetical protein